MCDCVSVGKEVVVRVDEGGLLTDALGYSPNELMNWCTYSNIHSGKEDERKGLLFVLSRKVCHKRCVCLHSKLCT